MLVKLMVHVYLTSRLVKLDAKTYDALNFMHPVVALVTAVAVVLVTDVFVVFAAIIVCFGATT